MPSVRHECKECGKIFRLKRYLTKHEVRHRNYVEPEEDEKPMEPLKCSMCDKVFPRLSHLQRHQMIHFNARNYACSFCEEKFIQKAHLTRHLARKHPNDPGVDVRWIACDQCGHLFKTSYEMNLHRKTAHQLHRCRRCHAVVEAGNDGLRRHLTVCRNKQNLCTRCEASFSRPADLAAHRITCLKKFAFICVPCETYFRQRVELDRHIKKLHFRSAKCVKCQHISESPVKNARHSKECLDQNICGYCGISDPDETHVSQNHWHRLKTAISLKSPEKQEIAQEDIPGTSNDTPSFNEGAGKTTDETKLNHFELKSTTLPEEKFNQRLHEETKDDEELFDFPEASSSQLDFSSTAFADEDNSSEKYLTFSILPKKTDLSFDLKGRLPAELITLFPELESTSIVLLNSGNASSRSRMLVRVPVRIPIPNEKNEQIQKWLDATIVLQDE